jgi:hypothetical protein
MAFNALTPHPSRILFIDTSYLKNTTEIDDNVDDKLLRTSIQYMQDKFILPILGNNMFEQWKLWIQSGVTLQNNAAYYFDANNLYVLETFIQPTLASSCMMELVYKINWQIRNKGIESARSEFSNPVTTKELNWLSENYRETASFYAQRTTQFLQANPDIFQNWLNPQLGTSGNGADLYYPEKTKYFCGIHMPDSTSVFAEGSGWGLSLNQKISIFGLNQS